MKNIFLWIFTKKQNEIEKIINELKDYNSNIIFFIPAIKINFYLKFFKKSFKGRKIFIGREMTKIHETFYREDLDTFGGFKENLKGELTVILSKKNNKNIKDIILNDDHLKVEITKYLKRYSLKDVVKLISEKNNLPKKKVYNLCLNIKKK